MRQGCCHDIIRWCRCVSELYTHPPFAFSTINEPTTITWRVLSINPLNLLILRVRSSGRLRCAARWPRILDWAKRVVERPLPLSPSFWVFHFLQPAMLMLRAQKHAMYFCITHIISSYATHILYLIQ